MRSQFHRFALLLLTLTACVAFVNAQPAPVSAAARSMPFEVGETLIYEGKAGKWGVSTTIGDMSFTVDSGKYSNELILRVDARSRGTLLKLFKYSFEQQIDSTVARDELNAFSTRKHDVQKQKVRDSIATFDYPNRKVTYVETDPNDAMRAPRTIASELEGPTHDIVSAIYLLRTLPLKVGYSTTIRVSDSGLVYDIPVRVTRRERQETMFGKQTWCLRIEPDVFGPGRFFEQKGEMIIWVTDDARHIPVRAQVKADVGKIDIRLKEIKNSRSVAVK